MSVYEYSKWDGSQEFQPQSADKAFDQLSEYMLQYGDQVLRNLDDLDDDEAEDLVELIQKEGLIEEDGEGKWQVSPKGLRGIQESGPDEPVPDLSARRDRQARHAPEGRGDGPARGLQALRLRRLAGEPQPARDAQERDGPPGGRHADPRSSREDYVVHETEYQTRCATVVLIDMSGSMSRYGKYATTKKVALALQAMVRAQYAQDTLQMVGFYTLRQRDDRAAAPQLGPQAGQHLRQPGPPPVRPRQPARSASRSTSPTSTPASGWPAASWPARRRRTSRSSSSPTASRPPTSRGARSS